MDIDVRQIMKNTKALATGHFVFKALHDHGAGYIDKDRFPLIGARNYSMLLEAEAENALNSGLDLSEYPAVALLTAAYGSIKQGLPLAAYLEKRTNVRIIVAETEVERNAAGKRYHVLPDNVKTMILGIPVLCAEDIVNDGTTVREINRLAIAELGTSLFGVLATVDRGGQTAATLNVPRYYPYMRVNMEKHDLRKGPCPQCVAGIPINTDLGKGEGWVKMFGQPPYPPDMDFSAFWAEK